MVQRLRHLDRAPVEAQPAIGIGAEHVNVLMYRRLNFLYSYEPGSREFDKIVGCDFGRCVAMGPEGVRRRDVPSNLSVRPNKTKGAG
jgi:hypothetical protein